MPLRIYDTRSRVKKIFTPLVKGKVSIYVCGITPYSPSHLGHARQAISFDIITRWLRKLDFEVTYITNFTDIDDKIIKVALTENVDFQKISERNIENYFHVMDKLNVLRADQYSRVTETIPEIIDMISILMDKKHAYIADDGVYFEIDTAPDKYGQLTGQTLEMVRSGAGGRVGQTGGGKRDHRDFALWKNAKNGEPYWPSPWGNGRPGWHIECSAMSLKHLGETFDIHGGGRDLMFPHHEAEIFQSECCLGREYVVKNWLHNGMINVDGEKMSKSLGNFTTISETFDSIEPLALRYALLNAPYRQPIEFNQSMLEESQIHYNRLLNTYLKAINITTPGDWSENIFLNSVTERFSDGMNDDFNTRVAFVEIQSVVKKLQESVSNNSKITHISALLGWLNEFAGNVLGLLPDEDKLNSLAIGLDKKRKNLSSTVEKLLEQRQKAREEKDWKSADRIRDELNSINVVVEDSPEGPKWKIEE
ncbi:MAG: cysteine--tRNA ligase [Candidatus Thalassarchaeaceae archaeon]